MKGIRKRVRVQYFCYDLVGGVGSGGLMWNFDVCSSRNLFIVIVHFCMYVLYIQCITSEQS